MERLLSHYGCRQSCHLNSVQFDCPSCFGCHRAVGHPSFDESCGHFVSRHQRGFPCWLLKGTLSMALHSGLGLSRCSQISKWLMFHSCFGFPLFGANLVCCCFSRVPQSCCCGLQTQCSQYCCQGCRSYCCNTFSTFGQLMSATRSKLTLSVLSSAPIVSLKCELFIPNKF